MAKRSWFEKLFKDNLDLGAVSEVRFGSAVGTSVTGWRFVLRSDEIRHIRGTHGGAREVLRGQIPITPRDFEALPRILSRSTSIRVSAQVSKRMRNRIVEVEHTIGSVRYHVDLAIQPGRKALTVQSFRKRKG